MEDVNDARQNGSIAHPFESLEAFGKLDLKEGDTVFFYGGDFFNGTIRGIGINGTFKKPVVFTTYGKEKAKIYAGDKEGFVFTGCKNFSISNFILYGSGRKNGNTTDGVKLVNCSSVKIKNLEIAGFQKAGLQLYNCRDAEINGVIAQDNGHSGILVEGDYQKRLSENIHFVNCRADNNPGDPTNLTNHSGNGIVVGNCRNVLIEYCTATNNGWDMPRIGNGPVGIWAYEADSVIIQHCISYRNKTAPGAADGGGFDLDGGVTNSIIQYCLSYENEGSGYGIFQYWSAGKWKNNIVRYCVSINDGRVTEKCFWNVYLERPQRGFNIYRFSMRTIIFFITIQNILSVFLH
jgi:polygalacturonase